MKEEKAKCEHVQGRESMFIFLFEVLNRVTLVLGNFLFKVLRQFRFSNFSRYKVLFVFYFI